MNDSGAAYPPPTGPPVGQGGQYPPPAQYPPPPQIIVQKQGGCFRWIGIAVVVFVVLIVIGAIFGANSTKSKVTLGNSGKTHTVVYKVEGTASSTDVTYSTPGGGTAQQNDLDVPITRKSDGHPGITFTFHDGEFLYMSAQNGGESGNITCVIEEDGVELARNTSSGAYAIVTCNGSA